MSKAYILGIDIGTSGTKVAVYDESLAFLASFSSEYDIITEQPGWAEQHPDTWWEATVSALKKMASSYDLSLVKSIGLTGQMHGLVLLDKDGTPLRSSIIWCDQRTGAECAEMTSFFGEEKIQTITGNPALPGFTAAKLRWVYKNQPDVFAKIDRVMLPKDYIRFRLCGIAATDYSDASGMQMLDLEKRQWNHEILSYLHIAETQLPSLHYGDEITGRVTRAGAKATGLPIGVPVVAGAGDQASSAIGNGIIDEGDMSLTIGSSGVIFAATKRLTVDGPGRFHTMCHAVRNMYPVMTVTQGAGASLKWFKDRFYAEEQIRAIKDGKDIYQQLNSLAEAVPIGSHGVVFLPYINGERSPHRDPDARGVFYNLSSFHQKDHLLRSVYEGISFSLAECYGILRHSGIKASRLIAAGGGARSAMWLQMLSDLFNKRIIKSEISDSGTLGAAMLAAVGVNLFPSLDAAIKTQIPARESYMPNRTNHEEYRGQYAVFRRLYRRLKPLFSLKKH